MIKRAFASIFISLLLTTCVIGQKIYRDGYIVTLKGDTLGGLVHHFEGNKVPQKIIFKRFDIATPREYNPKELLGFGYKNGNYFESKTISNKKVLVRCYVKGEISLYANGNKIYVEKGNTNPIEISKNEIIIKPNQKYSDHVELLRHLTSDAPYFEIPSNLALEHIPLSNQIVRYNKAVNKHFNTYHYDHKDEEVESYYSLRSKRQSIGLTTGIQRANASFSVNENYFTGFDEKSISNSLRLGVFYNFQISKTNKNLALQVEFHVANNNFSVYHKFERSLPTQTQYIEVLKKQTRISVPIKLIYTYPIGKLMPYASLGLSYNLLSNEEGTEYLDILNLENDLYSYAIDETSYTRNQDRIRLVLDLGIKYKINQKAFVIAGLSSETIMSYLQEGTAPFPKTSATDSFSFDYIHSPTIFLKRKSPIISINIGIGINI